MTDLRKHYDYVQAGEFKVRIGEPAIEIGPPQPRKRPEQLLAEKIQNELWNVRQVGLHQPHNVEPDINDTKVPLLFSVRELRFILETLGGKVP